MLDSPARIAEDRYEQVAGLTDGDDLPVLVSPELREREPIRHLHSVPILRGDGPIAQDNEHYHNDHHQPR